MMFDHGCDMINTFFATSTILRFFVIGNNWYPVLTLFAAMAQFYYATLEEYFLDGLFLPIINGANEIVFAAIGLCIFTFFKGYSFWQQKTIIPGLTNSLIVFYILIIGSILQVFIK